MNVPRYIGNARLAVEQAGAGEVVVVQGWERMLEGQRRALGLEGLGLVGVRDPEDVLPVVIELLHAVEAARKAGRPVPGRITLITPDAARARQPGPTELKDLLPSVLARIMARQNRSSAA